MIYLASPYTHPEREVRLARFNAACIKAAKMIAEGRLVFSPVCHSHPIYEAGMDALQVDWRFWSRIDIAFLSYCRELVVLTLEGWRESVGVQAEIMTARELGKPVSYEDA